MKDFNCKHAYRNEYKQVACDIDNKPCKYQRWCEMDGEWQTTNQCIQCEKGKTTMTEELKREKTIFEEKKVEEKPKKKEVQPPKNLATVVEVDGYGTIVIDERESRIRIPYCFDYKVGDKVDLNKIK